MCLLLAACAGGNTLPAPGTEPPPPAPPPPAVVTVSGGTGGGQYLPGEVITITAAAPAVGTVFDRWVGDVGGLGDLAQAQTTLTVPSGGASVTATYRTVSVGGPVTASIETDPVPGAGDAADDICIWVDPGDASRSVVIGTDKAAGYLLVYDLSGAEIQRLDTGKVNNVDLREGFPLGSETITLVAASDRTDDTIACYRFDASTRRLSALTEIQAGITVYGFCMYKSAVSGETYAFINSKNGEVEQWRLYDDGDGGVAGELVREFDLGDDVEGCVADDELGDFYIGEENVGIWKYGAEPGDTGRTQVDVTGANGQLTSDVEGLTIYTASGGTGYLIASSQGADEYVVYEREGANAYVMTFSIDRGTVDGTSDTDGIDVTNLALGPLFPSGVFVAQDGTNTGGQNFKLVPWERIAQAAPTPLTIDTSG